jgi:hypothetical protein
MGAEEKPDRRKRIIRFLLNERPPAFARPDVVLSFGTVRVEN